MKNVKTSDKAHKHPTKDIETEKMEQFSKISKLLREIQLLIIIV